MLVELTDNKQDTQIMCKVYCDEKSQRGKVKQEIGSYGGRFQF